MKRIRLSSRSADFLPGFSLTEMLTALSILLMIMLGVAVVFSNVSQALRQALGNSYAIRSKMDIARTLKSDVENINPDGFLCMANMRALAFQDSPDRDANGNAAFTGVVTNPNLAYDASLAQNTGNKGIGKRWFRCDLLSFCTSGYFPDQMGSSANNQLLYQNPGLATTDAWVTWGSAMVDTDANVAINMCNNEYDFGTWRPNNMANDWTLARRVVLLPGSVAASWVQTNLAMVPPMVNLGATAKDMSLPANTAIDVARFGIGDFIPPQSPTNLQNLMYRPRAMVKPSGLPLSRIDAARASVMLAGSVSDFSVEFAGDYLYQNNTTNTSQWVAGQDGEVDYMYADQMFGGYYTGGSCAGLLRAVWAGQLPPPAPVISGTAASQNRIYSKCTIWYGLHVNMMDQLAGYPLLVPPSQAGVVTQTAPGTTLTSSFPYNVMSKPGVSGQADLLGTYGVPPTANSPAPQWYMLAAFNRAFPHMWPRMLRISYRVHTGGTGDDPGVLIQNVYHLPAGR